MLATHPHLTLLERLDRHPLLRIRVESLLAVVEDAAGDGEQAHVAERRVIEELRQMGNEALTAWAERELEKQTGLAQVEPNWWSGGKKTPGVNFPVITTVGGIC